MLAEDKATIRNIGIITRQQQEVLKGSTVAIAGVGADGGMLAERLARAGIGRIKIADPGLFDETNLNRQFGADVNTIGRNKAEVIGGVLKSINPSLKLDIFNEGIDDKSADDFVSGADVVVDEIEYTRLDLSVLLHRAARKQGKYIFLGINAAWGANLFVFDPKGLTIEEYCGLPSGASLEEIRKFPLPLDRFCPKMPEYIAPEVIKGVISGKDIPSVSPAVSLTASLVSAEIILFLIDKQRNIPAAPGYIYIDLFRRELFAGNNT